MDLTETRKVGKHLFIFEKGDGSPTKAARTLITTCHSRDAPSNTEQKLPMEFIKYMKKLFSILDEEKRGFVKLQEIEARWSRNDTQLGILNTNGVLASLRRVTPSSGLLSFDRLCLGFQLALQKTNNDNNNSEVLKGGCCNAPVKPCDPGPSNNAEIPAIQRTRPQRPRSMVQLRHQKEPLDLSLAKRKGGILEGVQRTDKESVIARLRQLQQDEKVKNDKTRKGTATNSCMSTTKDETSSRLVNTLNTEWRGSQADVDPAQNHKENTSLFPRVRVHYQGARLNGTVSKNGLRGGSRDTTCIQHTSNGIIVAKESKLNELDTELRVFSDGLRAVEDIRDWFFTRITALQEERLYVKSVNKYCYHDYEAAIHTKRRQDLGLNHVNCKTFAIRVDQLKTCVERTKKMTPSSHDENTVGNEAKVAQLEKDKKALIRELFQYKSQQADKNCSVKPL